MEIQTKQLVMAVKQIAEEKNLPEEVVHDIIGQALAAAWRKDFGDKEQEVTAMINTNTGDVTITAHKTIVDKVEDPDIEISVADAQKKRKSAKLGETIEFKQKPTSFGRVAAQTAKQVILQKLREAEREVVLEEYSDKIGSVVTGVISRVEQRIVRVDLGRASGIMPKSEQIPGEYYTVGGRVKVFLKDVERENRGPQLILSRANEHFIEHLFKNEVPEMENGAVEIKAIAREAGVRTKIAVASTVPGVDPVGTFVGGHGTRVQAVMSEIGDQEKIDIITYDEDTIKYLKNALSPTEVAEIVLDKKTKKAVVKVAEDQLSVAIGRGGQNVRLASKLVGYEIDIEAVGSEKAVKAKRPKKNIEDSLLAAIASQAGDEAVAANLTEPPTEQSRAKVAVTKTQESKASPAKRVKSTKATGPKAQ
ncbi:MAG TPA: transcription termination factor NusA [Candidatus Saccharimonadales bacterium]